MLFIAVATSAVLSRLSEAGRLLDACLPLDAFLGNAGIEAVLLGGSEVRVGRTVYQLPAARRQPKVGDLVSRGDWVYRVVPAGRRFEAKAVLPDGSTVYGRIIRSETSEELLGFWNGRAEPVALPPGTVLVSGGVKETL